MNYEKASNGGDVAVLIPCTGTKSDKAGPAMEVYYPTGAIASVKSALRDGKYNSDVDTYFLSAQYGVIPIGKEIEPYEQEMSQDDVKAMSSDLGEMLEEEEYDICFSFVDDLYQKAVDEVAYAQNTKWSIETTMLRPCGRTARFDGAKVIRDIVRLNQECESAGEVSW